MAQSLSRRGLHATALEVAKLSLVLDWRDPLDLTQVIDYYACRCRNYAFLEVRHPTMRNAVCAARACPTRPCAEACMLCPVICTP